MFYSFCLSKNYFDIISDLQKTQNTTKESLNTLDSGLPNINILLSYLLSLHLRQEAHLPLKRHTSEHFFLQVRNFLV